MLAFALGLAVGAFLGILVMALMMARSDADEYAEYLEGLRRATEPHDWQKDGSDL